MDRHRLALEGDDVEAGGIVDQREAPLRRDQLGDIGQMAISMGSREDEGGRADLQRGDLRCHRPGMIDDMMRA